MIILKSVYQHILDSTPYVPPETGGIIGGQKGIVTEVYFDKGNNLLTAPSNYAPDIRMLNQVIACWEKQGIEFYGIFHSHYSRDRTLSPRDKKYIKKIMCAMPPRVCCLYFPIILPKETIIGYQASRYDLSIHIACDKIEILQNGG